MIEPVMCSPGGSIPSLRVSDPERLSGKKCPALYGLSLEDVAGLIPKRQFLLKTDQRAKVLNVDLDKRALAEYSNDPFSNARRDAAIAAHGYDAGMEILAAQ